MFIYIYSILGPLLFLIYINELPSVSTLFMPILFADDTNLFCTGQNLDDLVQKINIEMEKIYSCVKANKLSLNVDKTNFMLFTPKHFSRSMGNIYINGTCIIEVTETEFLEVIIDYKLNWSSHIMNINKKIAKSIGIILKARIRNQESGIFYFQRQQTERYKIILEQVLHWGCGKSQISNKFNSHITKSKW